MRDLPLPLETDCIRQPNRQLPSSSYNHDILKTLRTCVKESLQMHLIGNFHALNTSLLPKANLSCITTVSPVCLQPGDAKKWGGQFPQDTGEQLDLTVQTMIYSGVCFAACLPATDLNDC